MMRVLDLFSGLGAFSLGLERAGFSTAAFCEIDPFCRRVLAKHWPEVPILGDISAVENFPEADVICGGFPCQDVSRAGKRAGLSGERSGLYRQLVRAVRMVRPKHAIVENVAALVDDGMDAVLGDLAASGYDTEWDCVPAKAIGAPHERDRVWIVAHAQSSHDGRGHSGKTERQASEPGDGVSAMAVANADRVNRRNGTTGEDWSETGNGSEQCPAHAQSVGCGSRREGRPPDSFAWIRDATRWHAGHAYREGLPERKGQPADARQEQQAAERAAIGDVWQSRWPCEPALLGMDDGVADRVDRTRALGNSLIPQIPELIGRAILTAEAA